MHLFLTSSPCDDNVPAGCKLPCIWDRSNGFTARMLSTLPETEITLTVVAGDPDAFALNDEMLETFAGCFDQCGLHVRSAQMLDSRTAADAPRFVSEADIIILGGGYVPRQNRFFARIALKSLISAFPGTVVGISAGSMNCARTVYALPEEPGDAVDPDYSLFLPGLGLTDVQIIPHLQKLRDMRLDGMRMIDDIAVRDSFGRVFYAIPDGSYVYRHDSAAPLLCGEAYTVSNGTITRICSAGETYPIPV